METNSNQSATPSEADAVKAPELGVVHGSAPDTICVNCGIGYYLPSGRCDHCNALSENERLREALLHIANMPSYDQDDAHRLRYQAKQALQNTAVSQPDIRRNPA